MSEPRYRGVESALVHGGVDGDARTGAVAVPIYQTSTFAQPELGRNTGWEYSRTGNPTRAALEALISELEGGVAGFAFASGMSAIAAVLGLLKAGDRVLLSENVYGGTFRLLDAVLADFGMTYTLTDTTNLAALEAAFTPDVRALLVESPANPLLTVTDLAAAGQIAHRHGALYIVDNTFMTPYLQRPLALGADIVVHSATKYLGGHSDLVAGLVVTRDEAIAKRLAFLQNAAGAVLGPFDAFLLHRGIKTLAVRMDRHVENAERLAAFLSEQPAVKRVYYPGLPGASGAAVQHKQASSGGAMISFDLADEGAARRFFSALRLITLAESLGGVESLVCHPATMTHASIPAARRRAIGIGDGLVRFSVGIESFEDLREDLSRALRQAQR